MMTALRLFQEWTLFKAGGPEQRWRQMAALADANVLTLLLTSLAHSCRDMEQKPLSLTIEVARNPSAN